MNYILNRDFITLKLLSYFTAFTFGLILLSFFTYSNVTYLYLAWNLFLAWVPLILAYLWSVRLTHSRRLKAWKSVVMFTLWLLFFPNAPYLITDLVHLNNRYNPAIWSDALLLFTCALNGLIVGLYALRLVHKILDKYFKSWFSWYLIISSLLLSGYGIYLGRVLRWNSWDIFLHPFDLLVESFSQLTNPIALQMTFGFAGLLFMTYFLFAGRKPFTFNTPDLGSKKKSI